MKAILIEEFGGPEVVRYVDLPDPEPGDGEVVVEVARSGVNFADTHAIRDDYLAEQSLPLTPGGEIAGRTPDGRRVAALLATGGYAEQRGRARGEPGAGPRRGLRRPGGRRCCSRGSRRAACCASPRKLAEGETVVVGAAGGGTGSLAVQLAKRMGAGRVIALASSEAKRELALSAWAPTPRSTRAPTTSSERSSRRTGGKPVDVVLEMAGGAIVRGLPARRWRRSGAWSPSGSPRASRTRSERAT